MPEENTFRLGKFTFIKTNIIKAEEPKENTSQAPKGPSKVNRANKATTKPAESPLIRGFNFFDIFIFKFSIIKLYTFIYYIKFNDKIIPK